MTDTAPPNPARYPRTIRILHWLVVALVSLQYISGSGMAEAFPESLGEGPPTPAAAVAHAFVGFTILLAMVLRLNMRWNAEVPPPPSNEPRWLQWISRGTHYAFYFVLIAMPLVGATAALTRSEAVGEIHAVTSWLLIVLIAAHVAGAVWHISKRDGIFERISYAVWTDRFEESRERKPAERG